MTTIAVIGAGFGDEGKGLVTDFVTRRTGSKVVARFNGGGQAGHTVVEPTGRRHVFGHVGAGTFAGANTWLSRHFIVNPLLLKNEMLELDKKDALPDIYVHGAARVTTIYDMALNAAAELARGNNRHGSCGLGINETVTRDEAGFRLDARELWLPFDHLVEKLRLFQTEWVPRRLEQLGLSKLPDEFHTKTGHVLVDGNFAGHAMKLRSAAMSWMLLREGFERRNLESLILEGAQGLMLDEFLGEFPHVTRSVTGLPNAIDVSLDVGRRDIQAIYVTRAYATRHGAGWLSHEWIGINLDGDDPTDETNVHNQWQGTLRYAPLNIDELKKFIAADMERVSWIRLPKPVIAVTCLDQLTARANVVLNGEVQAVHREDIPQLISEAVGLKVGLVSRGPCYNDVEVVTDFGV